MTRAPLASSAMALADGSMPFSAWKNRMGRPEPLSIRSIRVPLTVSDCASLDDAADIPPPLALSTLVILSWRAFLARSSIRPVVLARELPFATARRGRSGRLALRRRHDAD